jgi:hypothetical protein
VRLRARLVSVVVLVVVGLAAAVPAGASTTQHPKYINAVHHFAPGTKAIPNKTLAKMGTSICSDLNSGTSFTAEAESLVNAIGNGKTITTKMLAAILKYSVIYICPSYRPELETFENSSTSAPATSHGSTSAHATTTTTAPPPPTAAFSCTGSAPEGVSITYGADTQNLDGGGSVPWSASLPIPDQAQYEAVNAQLQGPDGSISCMVTVTQNGLTTTQMGEGSGNYNIAAAQVCSGGDGTWEKC